jgi:DGQHR domain-containing protein
MPLDKKKIKYIVEPFEKEVYEILLKLDKNVEILNVDVFYHKTHRFDKQASIITDFEIHFRNDGKEYLIVIECKHHSSVAGNIMKDLEGFVFKINKIYKQYKSSDVIVKPIFLICIDSNEAIPIAVGNEAAKHEVPCYDRLLIDQLSESIDALSPGIAFLEFLHSYLNIDISFEPNPITFNCLINKNFSNPTYTFLANANDLIRISYVNRANINKRDLSEAYQRAIKVKRLEDIARFVLEQTRKSKIEVFPNNIVVNINDFRFIHDKKDSETGIIEIPNKYGALWIIDGQHRLYSFCKINDDDIRAKYKFIVTAYPNINLSEQAEIFYNINDKQEGINSDLIMFIQAQLLEQTKGFAAKVLLDIDKEEFFTKPIRKGFEERERGAWLKLSTLVNTLTEEELINYEKSKGGLLQKNRTDLETPFNILKTYLEYIKHHFRTSWEEGKKGFAQSNQGLAILFIVLKKIIESKTKSKEDLDDINENTFASYLKYIDSNTLNARKLTGRQLRDVRSRTDRREVARKLWEKIK